MGNEEGQDRQIHGQGRRLGHVTVKGVHEWCGYGRRHTPVERCVAGQGAGLGTGILEGVRRGERVGDAVCA